MTKSYNKKKVSYFGSKGEFERIYLEEGNENFYLDSYLADEIPGFVRDSVLVIPGGAYGEVCSDREGEPIALEFVARGYKRLCFALFGRRRSGFSETTARSIKSGLLHKK